MLIRNSIINTINENSYLHLRVVPRLSISLRIVGHCWFQSILHRHTEIGFEYGSGNSDSEFDSEDDDQSARELE